MAEATEIDDATREGEVPHPLVTNDVPIDKHCVGNRWSVREEKQLARLIAIIAMGQATYASHIVESLIPAEPAFTTEDLKHEAIVRLTVQDHKRTPRTGYPQWQRDGFIFEAISWISARQSLGRDALLKDPHISATSQGLDGLMIELSHDKAEVTRTTVFEDKCTDDPRQTFTKQVIPAFLDRHQNRRSAELVATASVLLKTGGVDDAAAARLSAGVTDRKRRRYRAAFALTKNHDCREERKELFRGYDQISGIAAAQRVGACFIVPGDLRRWFDHLAQQAIDYLEGLEEAED